MDTFLFHKSIFLGIWYGISSVFTGHSFLVGCFFSNRSNFMSASAESQYTCLCRCFHFAVLHFALWNILSMNNTRFLRCFEFFVVIFDRIEMIPQKMFTWWCSALFHSMFQMDHACNFCNRSIFCNIVEWYGAFDLKIIKMSSVPWDFYHICRAIALTSIDLHAHT